MTYFAVTDTDRAAGRATELGGAVGAPPFDTAFGRVAVLSDPAGGHFSVVTRPGRRPLLGRHPDPARGQVAAQGDRTGPGGGRNSGVGPGVRCPLAGSSSSWTWG
jgi:hypothetical protein